MNETLRNTALFAIIAALIVYTGFAAKLELGAADHLHGADFRDHGAWA